MLVKHIKKFNTSFKMNYRLFKVFLAIGYQSLKYRLRNRHRIAKPISMDPKDFKNEFTYRARHLLTHYVQQFNNAACSVATIATILNTATEENSHSKSKISQQDILNTVHVLNWKERVMKRRGLQLKELAVVVEHALNAYKIKFKKFEVKYIDDHFDIETEKKNLLSKLISLQSTENQYMIIHFNQGLFLRGLHLPHISPIGAFNTITKEILVLDVDKYGPGPYWIPFDLFFKGISDNFGGRMSIFGYSGGGYICFTLTTPNESTNQ
ncbi:MAG: phytochelatin synthase family protein [Proteobacteria bacterium]|nr:phytochelatin synthase family protein [Pseudomonadota bacterium]